jgi:hypothetical protein
MEEELIVLIFLYILPAILMFIVIYHHEKEVFVIDLIKIFLLSIIPVANFCGGYVGGFLMLINSKRVNKFLNKKIK